MSKLMAAAVDELSRSTYGELTVRTVAARAAVSPGIAYSHFPSKDALIAGVYLHLLRDAATFTDGNDSAETRVIAQLRELVLLLADKPHLADACTIALMADDLVVDDIRGQIAVEISSRIASSLGPGFPAAVISTLHMLFSGAMMHARSTVGGYGHIAEKLSEGVSLVFRSRLVQTVSASKQPA